MSGGPYQIPSSSSWITEKKTKMEKKMSHTPKLLPLPRTATVVFLCSLVAVSFTSNVTSAAKLNTKQSQSRKTSGWRSRTLTRSLAMEQFIPFLRHTRNWWQDVPPPPLPPPLSLTLLAKLFFMINIFYGRICANVFFFSLHLNGFFYLFQKEWNRSFPLCDPVV